MAFPVLAVTIFWEHDSPGDVTQSTPKITGGPISKLTGHSFTQQIFPVPSPMLSTDCQLRDFGPSTFQCGMGSVSSSGYKDFGVTFPSCFMADTANRSQHLILLQMGWVPNP